MPPKNGYVRGTVEDPTGGAVVQAALQLTPKRGGPPSKTLTDEAGHFVFAGVAGGEYVLAARKEGFENAELHLQLESSPLPEQVIRLRIAEIKEDLTVSARSDDPISQEQNATAVHLDGEWLRNLPAKYDGVLSTASLFVETAAKEIEGTKIVVDGVEGNSLDVPSSSIKTIAVNSNPYSTEFSRPGKGRIEVTTRGGSLRRFHKRFSFAFRDAAMDAHNPFDTVVPPRRREWTEGALDGPLASGKATFFLSGDYLRDNDNTFVTAILPSGPLSTTLPIPIRAAHLLGRTDLRLNSDNVLSLRYNWSDSRLPDQGVGAFDLPQRAWNSDSRAHEFRLSDSAILNSALLNEFRFDYKYRSSLATSGSDAPAVLVNGYFSDGGAQISRNNQERDIEFQDLVSWVHGKQSWRGGAVAKSKHVDYTDSSDFGGTYTFSNLAGFLDNQPLLYTINQGDPRVIFRQNEFAAFVQDEIRILPRLSLMLGLRYEFQSNLDDHRNLAPRVALSAASADGRTILRAGAGIFYQRQPLTLEEQYLLLNGSRLRQLVLSNPAFPVSGNPAALADQPSDQPPPSVQRIDPRIHAPYVFQSSLGLERKLGRDTVLSTEYTMLRGVRLYRQRDVNAPLPATGERPDPDFLNVDQFESSGGSRFNSLTLKYQTTLLRRLQFLSQYTFSHSTDDTAGLSSFAADNFDLRVERGRSDFDQRHRFNFAGVFNAPWNSVAVDGSFVGGAAGVLYNGAQALFGGPLVPVGSADFRWLILPGPGNAGRNPGNGPGLAQVDLRLTKRFVLREKDKGSRDVELRIDAFNATNRANWTNYIGVLTSPFFGHPNDAHPAREIQLSVRFKF